MTQIQTLAEPGGAFPEIAAFVRDLRYEDLPEAVRRMAPLYMLDLIGVAIAGHALIPAQVARDFAVRHWAAGDGAPSARLWLDGRRVSLPGFAYATATQIDNLDAHDGWQPAKGHAGAALLPALAAFAQDGAISGQEALTALVIGYEIAYRAAIALHETVPDYHTSGAWNALGCAAIGAKLRGQPDSVLRHAFGIAEYHGPRSQMMREIANPTMLHDGSGWGAPVGVAASLLAEEGFTGAPAATVEFADAAPHWSSLGSEWLTIKQYIKPYPVCRWAHGAIDAALNLRSAHAIDPAQIERVDIGTFAAAAALSCAVPETTTNAQYALGWPVAAALVRGEVGVAEVTEQSFSDPALVEMTRRIAVHVDPEIEVTFPEERLATVAIRLRDGRCFESGPTRATGGPEPQPSHDEVLAKFGRFASPVVGERRTAGIVHAVLDLPKSGTDFGTVLGLLETPAG